MHHANTRNPDTQPVPTFLFQCSAEFVLWSLNVYCVHTGNRRVPAAICVAAEIEGGRRYD
jgi:hypothetical protein